MRLVVSGSGVILSSISTSGYSSSPLLSESMYTEILSVDEPEAPRGKVGVVRKMAAVSSV